MPTVESPAGKLSRAVARAIVASLGDGVVPNTGVDFFTARRERWLKSLGENLEDLGDPEFQEGQLRIFNGRNGDGKSHLMRLLMQKALDSGVPVTRVVISSTRDGVPLHRWDRVYGALAAGITTPTRPEQRGIRAIFNPQSPDPAIADVFQERAVSIRQATAIEPNFATAIYRYATEQTENLDREQDLLLLGGWLEGQGPRLTDMAITARIDQSNAARMLRSLVLTLTHFGFPGLVVLVDEVESVLNLTASQRRSSYQTLRHLVDREGIPSRALIVASTTPPMFTDPDRGMQEYPALWGRLQNAYTASGPVNYRSTVVDLTRTPLTAENYEQIGRSIRAIHARAYDWSPDTRVTDEFVDAASKLAASGALTLTYSPTRVFVKLVADTLELAEQHADFMPSLDSLRRQFGEVDERLAKQDADRQQAEGGDGG